MKQQFLQVWRKGELWYEFPAENEDNVRNDLIAKELDRVCDIKPAGLDVQVIKESIKDQVTEIDLSAKPKQTRNRQPKAEKAINHDTSRIHPDTI